MNITMNITQCIQPGKIGLCLVLSLVLLMSFGGMTHAYESLTTTISFYQEFSISSGMTELDPTVITIIIGDASEIEIISAPEIDPLFEFGPQVDLYLA